MGLFARLFGNQPKEDPRRRAVLDRVRTLASQPFMGGADLDRLRECFPDAKDFDLKLDAVNNLFELDCNAWAEALALDVAHDEDIPLPMLKGLIRHFISDGRVEEVVTPMEWLIDERPSETDMALLLGRYLLRKGEYERCLEDMEGPLKLATESRHLFAICGEALFRLKKWEEAVIHLRTSCELFEQAFRLHQVLPDDMTSEQFEFTRLFGMLKDAAREHYGPDEMEQAFEGISIEPQSFGLMKEAEELAAARIEYTPSSMTMLSLGDLEKCCAEMAGAEESEPCRLFYEGLRAMREGRYDEAMQGYREALQLDIEAYGSYFGWAACENLQRSEPIPAGIATLPPEQLEALEKVVRDWHALAAAERKIATAALAPVANYLHAMAEAGATIQVHPPDVRLRDLYPQKVEMRFEPEGKAPQAAPAFASKLNAHIRIDEFLHVRPEQFTFARMAGYVLADTVERRGGRDFEAGKNVMNKARGLVGGGQRIVSTFDSFIATALELLACRRLFGEEAQNEFADLFEKAGVFSYLESLK